MERSVIRGRGRLTPASAIHGATYTPSFNTGPAILGRSFAPARAVLGVDAMRRPSLTPDSAALHPGYGAT